MKQLPQHLTFLVVAFVAGLHTTACPAQNDENSDPAVAQSSAASGDAASALDLPPIKIDRRATIKREDWFVRPWIMHAPAFAIADNLYYVGNQWFASHLIVGEKGIVLIDTPHKEHTYLLLESIRSLGFDPADITLILHTHYHIDHTGATRRLKEISGAVAGMGAADIANLQKNSSTTFTHNRENETMPYFEMFEVERPLEHGDIIDLGNMAIHCHHTPGHTAGTMSYSLEVTIDGEQHNAFLFGGPGLNFLKLDRLYHEGAEEEFTATLDYLEAQDIDLWLGAHPFVNGTLGKYEKVLQGIKPSPFIDRAGWKRFLLVKRRDFEKLVAQKRGEANK